MPIGGMAIAASGGGASDAGRAGGRFDGIASRASRIGGGPNEGGGRSEGGGDACPP
jgi:hypothetical protein